MRRKSILLISSSPLIDWSVFLMIELFSIDFWLFGSPLLLVWIDCRDLVNVLNLDLTASISFKFICFIILSFIFKFRALFIADRIRVWSITSAYIELLFLSLGSDKEVISIFFVFCLFGLLGLLIFNSISNFISMMYFLN
jgi:hypothetical protein